MGISTLKLNGCVKFNVTLSEEQKKAKEQIMNHAFSFVVGKAGSGKTLLMHVHIKQYLHYAKKYHKDDHNKVLSQARL